MVDNNPNAQTADVPLEPVFRFFELPREIRDEIYTQYCYSNPRSDGPLADYVEIPSPAPLAANRQLRAELSSTFYKSLGSSLTQNRVCLQLRRREGASRGSTRYIGWNTWSFHFDTSVRKINIWIRDGVDKGEYAAWWVDAKNLISMKEFTKLNTPLGVEDAVLAFERFGRVLEGMKAVLRGDGNRFEAVSRLDAVRFRIKHTLREVGELLNKEEEKASRSLWQRCGNERYQGATP